MGIVACRHGECEEALSLCEESLAIMRELRDAHGISWCLALLGELAGEAGDYPRARALLEESLAMRKQTGYKWGIAECLGALGVIGCLEGNYTEACRYERENLSLLKELGIRDKMQIGQGLAVLSGAMAERESPEEAARLQGSAVALFEAEAEERGRPASAQMEGSAHDVFERGVGVARRRLGEERYAQLRGEGRLLSLDQAIACALRATTNGG
jgi:hypothetical protein